MDICRSSVVYVSISHSIWNQVEIGFWLAAISHLCDCQELLKSLCVPYWVSHRTENDTVVLIDLWMLLEGGSVKAFGSGLCLFLGLSGMSSSSSLFFNLVLILLIVSFLFTPQFNCLILTVSLVVFSECLKHCWVIFKPQDTLKTSQNAFPMIWKCNSDCSFGWGHLRMHGVVLVYLQEASYSHFHLCPPWKILHHWCNFVVFQKMIRLCFMPEFQILVIPGFKYFNILKMWFFIRQDLLAWMC